MSQTQQRPTSRPAEQGANKATTAPHSNSSFAQRQRVLQALRKGPLSTLQARSELDVLHPAARVQELRKQGHNIITQRETVETTQGQRHSVARYVLLAGKWAGRAA